MQAKREEVGKVYFLVGPPTDEKLLKSYESALKLLRSFVLHHEIVTEDRSEDVAEEVREIAEEMVARVTTKV
jgi:tRNA G37 N-methylase Trm5